MAYYKVEQEGQKPRLIEAGTPAEALRHAAKSTFTISPALKTEDVVALMTGGTAAEKAGEFAEEPAGEQKQD